MAVSVEFHGVEFHILELSRFQLLNFPVVPKVHLSVIRCDILPIDRVDDSALAKSYGMQL